eukprot:2465754-Amphidinium_carterae.2
MAEMSEQMESSDLSSPALIKEVLVPYLLQKYGDKAYALARAHRLAPLIRESERTDDEAQFHGSARREA